MITINFKFRYRNIDKLKIVEVLNLSKVVSMVTGLMNVMLTSV